LHETEWFEQVQPTDGLLFLAGGVFVYQTEAQMKEFFIALADRFESCELFFDAMSPLAVNMAKKMVLKKGGMSTSDDADGWGVKSAKSLEKWDERIRVIDTVPMYQGVKTGIPLTTKVKLFVPDLLGFAMMMHLRIDNAGA
tara:strand:- start:322 stop:744 length:423 start_codon:yes stop_codon:yes gene_type:complete